MELLLELIAVSVLVSLQGAVYFHSLKKYKQRNSELSDSYLALERKFAGYALDLPQLESENKILKKKSSEYFEKIEEVLKERDVWRDHYYEQSMMHDNAQILMMTAIAKLHSTLEKEQGISVTLPSVIEKVREEFSSTHGIPSKEALKEQPQPSSSVTTSPEAGK